jgi:hypothetical protein
MQRTFKGDEGAKLGRECGEVKATNARKRPSWAHWIRAFDPLAKRSSRRSREAILQVVATASGSWRSGPLACPGEADPTGAPIDTGIDAVDG